MSGSFPRWKGVLVKTEQEKDEAAMDKALTEHTHTWSERDWECAGAEDMFWAGWKAANEYREAELRRLQLETVNIGP